MKIFIYNDKAREVLFDSKYYKTQCELEVSFSEAMRLRRVSCQKVNFINHEKVPYVPSRKINFISDVDSESGWGNATIALLKNSMHKYDITLIGKVHPSVKDYDIIAMSKKDIDQSALTIWHEQPRSEWLEIPFSKNIAVVPFETTQIPRSWVDRINKFDALFVPCKQNIEAFKSSGVNVPIELLHWGVDTKKFPVIERKLGRPFTFGTMGALSVRKGTDLLVRAFEEEFKSNENIALICKTSNMHYHFMSKDKRIRAELGPWPHDEILKNFYAKIDCFVFPTRGEGWGLPAIEALATGIPTIATGWSGIVEFLNNDVGYLIDHSMVPAKDFSETVYKEDCGYWAEPSLQHLKQLMRHAYEHQDEVKEKGAKAVEYINKNFLWKDKIEMFHAAIDKHNK